MSEEIQWGPVPSRSQASQPPALRPLKLSGPQAIPASKSLSLHQEMRLPRCMGGAHCKVLGKMWAVHQEQTQLPRTDLAWQPDCCCHSPPVQAALRHAQMPSSKIRADGGGVRFESGRASHGHLQSQMATQTLLASTKLPVLHCMEVFSLLI